MGCSCDTDELKAWGWTGVWGCGGALLSRCVMDSRAAPAAGDPARRGPLANREAGTIFEHPAQIYKTPNHA
jgi:hypothetical protein